VIETNNKIQSIKDKKWDLKGKLIESYYKLDKLKEFDDRNPRVIDKFSKQDWIHMREDVFDKYKKSFIRETNKDLIKSRNVLERIASDNITKKKDKDREKELNKMEQVA